MSRYHWWGFIVNQAGEPIENAEITVKEAGSDVLANIYYDEFGNANSAENPALSAGPQLSTLSNGYYEFWIGDISEPWGYRNEQKFKLEWIRIGVAHGEIDYINVFPLGPQIEQVSITDCVSPSVVKNKLISDYLACKWDSHVDSNIIEDGDFNSVHGLDFVNVDEMDTLPNKIINNYYGFHWWYHKLSTVQDYHPSAGRPHGLEEVNPLDGDSTLRNKVVSNRDLFNINGRITDLREYVDDSDSYLQWQIDNLQFATDQSKSGWWTVYEDMWVDEGANDIWYCDINHDMDIQWPIVFCWQISTSKVIQPFDIVFISENIVRIKIINNNMPNDPTIELQIRIANGGVHRHPPLP